MGRITSTLEGPSAEAQVPERHPHAAVAAPQLLDTVTICELIGIERHTWARWVKSRQAPARVPNVPGHPRWRADDIDRFARGLYGARYFGKARRGR